MSSVLEKNLRLCRKYWPNVYCELQEVTTDERYICYQTETPNRTLNLYDSRTDRIYYENSDLLGSAAEHLSERCGNLQGITLFFGFGLGYGPLLLLNTKSHFERALLIFEKDPRVILKAFEHIDFEELFKSDDVNLLTGRQLKHCSSDIYRAFDKGAYFYPLIMGHEISGQIVKVGEKVKSFNIRDKVSIFPLLPCFKCNSCKK